MSLLIHHPDASISTDPFPHVLIEPAFAPELIDELVDSFPPLDTFVRGRKVADATKLHLKATEALDSAAVSARWKQIVHEHVSRQHLATLVQLFDTQLAAEYPRLHEQLQRPQDLRIGLRNRDGYGDHDLLLDAQFIVHTPARTAPATDRGPHAKVENKLFEAHLMLRPRSDDTPGGDLELFSIRPGCCPRFGRRNCTDERFLVRSKVIPAGCNRLFLFLNTPRSLQRWSIRGRGDVPLMYFNFLVETPAPLFALRHHPLQGLRSAVGRRLRRWPLVMR